MKYAILNPAKNAVVDVRDYDVLPNHAPGQVRPLVSSVPPAYNPRTQQLVRGFTIATSQVTETWTVVALPATLPAVWTAYEFLQRLTSQERRLVWNRSKTDDDIAEFLMFAQAAQEIVSNDPATVAGMDMLVAKNILSAARKAEILDGA